MKMLIIVFFGGGLGSALRYGLSKWLSSYSAWFPYGTLICNITSSLILGYLLGKSLDNQLPENNYLLWAVGFCGGFSTFSTFSAELYKLINEDKLQWALGYIILSLLLGVLCIFLGIKLNNTL